MPALSWQPSALISTLQARARIIKQIRDFFTERNVLEVETPLIASTSVTDPFIQSIPVYPYATNHKAYYLQTSPEYAMKRLLAAGSGPIYQITKAFRQDEVGQFHNPEFTMLEWYRPHFNHHDLMNEVDELLQLILNVDKAERKTYQEIFISTFNINPHKASLNELANCAKQNGIVLNEEINDRDTWLQLLMSHCVEPTLAQAKPCFIFDFPASQCALAKIIEGSPPVAARFEVYFKGIELANGFYELQNAHEQKQRFEENNSIRKKLQLPQMAMDENFLTALTHGLPDCAGVALGIDRLMMLATNTDTIAQVLSFDFKRV